MLYQYDFNLMLDHLEKEGVHYYDLTDQVKETLFEADAATGEYDEAAEMVVLRVRPLFSNFTYLLPVPADACRPVIGAVWTEDHYEKVYAH